jgi:hypothetical protein
LTPLRLAMELAQVPLGLSGSDSRVLEESLHNLVSAT